MGQSKSKHQFDSESLGGESFKSTSTSASSLSRKGRNRRKWRKKQGYSLPSGLDKPFGSSSTLCPNDLENGHAILVSYQDHRADNEPAPYSPVLGPRNFHNIPQRAKSMAIPTLYPSERSHIMDEIRPSTSVENLTSPARWRESPSLAERSEPRPKATSQPHVTSISVSDEPAHNHLTDPVLTQVLEHQHAFEEELKSMLEVHEQGEEDKSAQEEEKKSEEKHLDEDQECSRNTIAAHPSPPESPVPPPVETAISRCDSSDPPTPQENVKPAQVATNNNDLTKEEQKEHQKPKVLEENGNQRNVPLLEPSTEGVIPPADDTSQNNDEPAHTPLYAQVNRGTKSKGKLAPCPRSDASLALQDEDPTLVEEGDTPSPMEPDAKEEANGSGHVWEAATKQEDGISANMLNQPECGNVEETDSDYETVEFVQSRESKEDKQGSTHGDECETKEIKSPRKAAPPRSDASSHHSMSTKSGEKSPRHEFKGSESTLVGQEIEDALARGKFRHSNESKAALKTTSYKDWESLVDSCIDLPEGRVDPDESPLIMYGGDQRADFQIFPPPPPTRQRPHVYLPVGQHGPRLPPLGCSSDDLGSSSNNNTDEEIRNPCYDSLEDLKSGERRRQQSTSSSVSGGRRALPQVPEDADQRQRALQILHLQAMLAPEASNPTGFYSSIQPDSLDVIGSHLHHPSPSHQLVMPPTIHPDPLRRRQLPPVPGHMLETLPSEADSGFPSMDISLSTTDERLISPSHLQVPAEANRPTSSPKSLTTTPWPDKRQDDAISNFIWVDLNQDDKKEPLSKRPSRSSDNQPPRSSVARKLQNKLTTSAASSGLQRRKTESAIEVQRRDRTRRSSLQPSKKPAPTPTKRRNSSASRIHSAVVSGINPETRSVTVEWFEQGETKGKEIELGAILSLNQDLLSPSDNTNSIPNKLSKIAYIIAS
eukprot:snap_masked-scaffold1416_size42578-processed-gene-0.4 protein:Tk08796 transcript:snap_masked-scaffold1416_size42578-processed-gene-0.4-mRNA-1 annotation:"sjchgc08027 protein"